MTKFNSRLYNWYLGFLVLVNLLPFLGPVFLKLSETNATFLIPAKIIYFAYSFTCHQFDYRSLHLFDYQYAWCARDMGIWLGILFAAIAVKYWGIRRVGWYWVIPFMIPIALDGGIQTIASLLQINPATGSGMPLYISNNLVRFLTGSFFGVGLSLWLSTIMIESLGEPIVHLGLGIRHRFGTGILMALLFTSYLVIIFAWQATSSKNLPSDVLDSAVKTPIVGFYTRRLDAICPGYPSDFIQVDCFLK